MEDRAQYNEGARGSHSIKLSDGDLVAATKICREVIKSKQRSKTVLLVKESLVGMILVSILIIVIFIISSIL